MILVRRLLVLAALMFWQGGFTFYASVVVPIGQEVLGHLGQGFITRQVTNYLNLSGGVALLLLAWDIACEADPHRWRRRFRSACWLVMVLMLVAMLWLHHYLDGLLDLEAQEILNRKQFRPGHRTYLWLSTVQWLAALGYLGLSLQSWQVSGRAREPAEAVSA